MRVRWSAAAQRIPTPQPGNRLQEGAHALISGEHSCKDLVRN
jgi:hypothetical protein